MPTTVLAIDSPIQSLLSLLNGSQDQFDVVAACYHTIMNIHMNTKHGYETRFILEIDDLHKTFSEEYVKSLESVRRSIFRYIGRLFGDTLEVEYFADTLDDLTQMIKQLPIPGEIEEERYVAHCAFYIIEAIDMQLECSGLDITSRYLDNGPLNKAVCRDNCFVYFHESNSFLSDIYHQGADGFRKPLRPARLGSLFHKLLIFDKSDFCTAAPQIARVCVSNSFKEQLAEKEFFRIASIPFIGYNTFDFCKVDSDSICKGTPDGAFYIDYNKNSETENTDNMLRLLDLAIKHEANIIVFPEFVMSKTMLAKLKSFLKSKKPKCLALVIAGTNYEYSLDGVGNNVMHIFNSGGCHVGKYYKFSPFLSLNHEFVHGVQYGVSQNDTVIPDPLSLENSDLARRRYIRNGEVLSDPGKECTIVDIEGIGRVLPAICGDVTDGYYTDNLAKLFMPSLLVIPSWSPSVTSFHSRLSVLAETIHTTSVLCNCCNAVSHEKPKIGLLFFPQKHNSEMVTARRFLKRSNSCVNNCDKCNGCLHLIDIKYAESELNAKVKHILADS